MKQKSIAIVRTFLTLFAAFAAALAVHAQETREGGDRAIEEVIVTAQRIVENVQQVPIAVTALSASALEDQQIINPSDLQLNARTYPLPPPTSAAPASASAASAIS